MTSKSLEALEALEELKTYLPAIYSEVAKCLKIIKKDLERLDKFEKAIDILKDRLTIEFDDKYNEINFKLYACSEIDYVYISFDDKSQYELLKEMLK